MNRCILLRYTALNFLRYLVIYSIKWYVIVYWRISMLRHDLKWIMQFRSFESNTIFKLSLTSFINLVP